MTTTARTSHRTRNLIVVIVLALIIIGGVTYGIIAWNDAQVVSLQNQQLRSAPLTGIDHVQLKNFAVSPANIQVHVGQTVTWTNDDDAAHSVTFDNHLADSGLFKQGQTYQFTFTTVGTYRYHCTVHPAMVGQVVVVP